MDRIDVTKTSMPPLDEYVGYLQQIWDRTWLTNQGPLLRQFEEKTQEYLGVDNLQLLSNGTIALQVALRALDITEGEIITTPFSYVATASAILWERCTPVFVDIDPDTLCIDPAKIEAAITENTRAIMPVYVFGFPCDVDKIGVIAKKHNLKVIYDGAHAFGVKYKGKSLLDYGDVSMCSFHATKLFHTIEGGCLVSRDRRLNERIELIKHFGHVGDEHYVLGTNAKASEFQAAMGLANLNHIDSYIAGRKRASELYDKLLDKKFVRPKPKATEPNYAYYPVVFASNKQLEKAFAALNAENIFPRRYFYPSLNKLPYVEAAACPVSEDIASRIACLPLYADLPEEVITKIATILNEL